MFTRDNKETYRDVLRIVIIIYIYIFIISKHSDFIYFIFHK